MNANEIRSKIATKLFKLAAWVAPNKVKAERISPRTGKPVRKYEKRSK